MPKIQAIPTGFTVMSKYFLDIASSVTGHAWLDALDLEGNELAGRLQQQFGASSTVARLLAAQGVTEPQFYSYLDPKLRDLLPNPKSFKDMELALDCIIEAIEGKVKIAIYGDYDVDGACSAALMKLFLTHLGAECLIYIPQRLEEGYGLNNQAMQHLQQLGCGLV
ncbi:MAG: single-stranded-DNA-specific exonuclease RecJ, partial [Alphaproteobacteria bacterium]|nr:single-stranded-DNA-specific exonuclease RecJ [Alphaproteobacteria bacterium]